MKKLSLVLPLFLTGRKIFSHSIKTNPLHLKLLPIFLFLACTTMVSAQQHATGVILDDSAYQVPELTPVASVFAGYRYKSYVSFRKYTPLPQSQGECQSCVGWACAYAAMTTMWAQANGVENKVVITQNAFNPDYLYFSLTASCNTGADIYKAMDKMKNSGLVLNRYSTGPDTGKAKIQAEKLVKIGFYDRIFEFNSDSADVVNAVRTCLNNGVPVIIVDHIDHNLDSLYKKNFVWVPKKVPDENAYHAMCVIGFDDKLKRFEIMNSWGTNWGDDGYFYESYKDFGRTTRYGFAIDPGFYPDLQTNIIDVAGDVKIEKNISQGSDKYAEIKPVLVGNCYVVNNIIKNVDTYRLDLIDLKKDRFTYVVGMGPDRKAQVLFSSQNSALSDKISMLVVAHNDVTVTPLTTVGSLGSKPGIYQYCVLYSVNPIAIEEVLKQVNIDRGNHINNKINNVLGARLIPQATINYKSGDISAKGMMSSGDIIPLYFRVNVKN